MEMQGVWFPNFIRRHRPHMNFGVAPFPTAAGLPGPRTLTSLDWIEGDASTSAEELRKRVRERKQQGADLVKIFASRSQRVGATPTLSEEQLRDVLKNQKRRAAFEEYIGDLRKKGKVTVKEDVLPKV